MMEQLILDPSASACETKTKFCSGHARKFSTCVFLTVVSKTKHTMNKIFKRGELELKLHWQIRGNHNES